MTTFEKAIYTITHFETPNEFAERKVDIMKQIKMDLNEIHRNFEANDVPNEFSTSFKIIKKAETTADWRVYFLRKGYATSYVIYSEPNGVITLIELFQGYDNKKYYIREKFHDECISISYHMIDRIFKPLQFVQNWIKDNVEINNEKVFAHLKN